MHIANIRLPTQADHQRHIASLLEQLRAAFGAAQACEVLGTEKYSLFGSLADKETGIHFEVQERIDVAHSEDQFDEEVQAEREHIMRERWAGQ